MNMNVNKKRNICRKTPKHQISDDKTQSWKEMKWRNTKTLSIDWTQNNNTRKRIPLHNKHQTKSLMVTVKQWKNERNTKTLKLIPTVCRSAWNKNTKTWTFISTKQQNIVAKHQISNGITQSCKENEVKETLRH